MKTHEKVLIAVIGRSVGLKGEHKLHLKCDFPGQFKAGALFGLENGQMLEIEKFSAQRSLVKFKNYNYKEESQKLVNQPIYTSISKTRESCALKKGEFFWFDIVGALVVEDEVTLGQVKEIERIAKDNYLIVKTDDAFAENTKQFYIPYIDNYIVKFDQDTHTIFTKNARDILLAS